MAPSKPITVQAIAPGATSAKPRTPARIETRTPGSNYILPANPLAALADESLEGFVERELEAAIEPSVEELPAPAPLRLARGTQDEVVEPVDDDEPTKPTEVTFDAGAAEPTKPTEATFDTAAEPLPPPPEAAPLATSAVDEPDIEVTPAVEPVGQKSRRRGRWLALAAATLVLAAGAGALAIYAGYVQMPMKQAPAASPEVEPTLTLSRVVATEMRVEGTEQTEAAPPAPIEIAQPTHAVLIRTWPGSARVVVGDQSFGTTPTYIKIPASTPVDVQITRPGFAPVTRTVTSTRRFDQVFVRLQPTSPRRVIRPRVQPPAQPAVVDLSNL